VPRWNGLVLTLVPGSKYDARLAAAGISFNSSFLLSRAYLIGFGFATATCSRPTGPL
jgi:hypothetical protein